MKKQIYFLLLMAAIFSGCQSISNVKEEPAISAAPTENGLSGIINKDATVSGVVKIIGDVYIPKGVTLTITPGTTVIFQKSESTKIEPLFLSTDTELLVRGSIIANGNKDAKITFISNQDKPGLKDYTGIILLQTGETSFSNCIFKNAITAISAEQTKLKLTDCQFENCFYAVSAIDTQVLIENSIIKDCDKGFYFHRGSAGVVTNCSFVACQEDAVYVDKMSRIEISKNVFKDNLWAISTMDYTGEALTNNEFINNKINARELNY